MQRETMNARLISETITENNEFLLNLQSKATNIAVFPGLSVRGREKAHPEAPSQQED